MRTIHVPLPDRLAEEIRAYAEAVAGTDQDLDPELEEGGLESLLSEAVEAGIEAALDLS